MHQKAWRQKSLNVICGLRISQPISITKIFFILLFIVCLTIRTIWALEAWGWTKIQFHIVATSRVKLFCCFVSKYLRALDLGQSLRVHHWYSYALTQRKAPNLRLKLSTEWFRWGKTRFCSSATTIHTVLHGSKSFSSMLGSFFASEVELQCLLRQCLLFVSASQFSIIVIDMPLHKENWLWWRRAWWMENMRGTGIVLVVFCYGCVEFSRGIGCGHGNH